MKPASSLTFVTLSAILVACSPAPTNPNREPPAPSTQGAASPTPPPPVATPAAAPNRVLQLSGLGALKVGEALPAGGAWAAPGVQAEEGCRAVRSSAYPGVYALLEGGKVRRITVGQGSDVKLVEGVGVGSSESEVRKWFAGFRSEPHKYEEAPAKYLSAPNASNSDSALRFEISPDGRVKMMHVGQMPQLAYVEGCG